MKKAKPKGTNVLKQYRTGGRTGDPETITIGGMTFPAIGLPKTQQEAADMQAAAAKLDVANQAVLKKNRIKERKAAMAAKDNKSVPFKFPDGTTKTYYEMTPREKLYVSGKALESRGRLDENEESMVDEFNPLNILGNLAGNLGQAPYQAKRSGSLTPYLTAVGAPLAVGALAGLGANTTGEFINNLANPLAGLDEPLTRMIGNPRELQALKSTIKNRISPTKVPTLSTAEQDLLSTVRNVGSIAKSGDVANNPELIKSLRKQGESLSDSQFKRLTGHSREELDQLEEFITTDDPVKANLTPEQRREALQFTDEQSAMGSINLTRPPNYRANRQPEVIPDTEFEAVRPNPPQREPQTNSWSDTGAEETVDEDLLRMEQEEYQRFLDRHIRPSPSSEAVEGTRDLNGVIRTPQTPSSDAIAFNDRIQEMLNRGSSLNTSGINDMYLRTGNPVMDKARVATNRLTNPNQSLISRLNTKLSNTLPEQKDLASENLFHALFRNADNNPAAQMKGAYQKVLNASKGETFKPAGSLSSDSYPMSLKLAKKAVDKDLVNVNFHGYYPMNSLGFSQTAGIDKALNLKEINTAIQEMNKSLPGKKLPLAYEDEFGINYPDYSVTRKVLAGLSLGSAAAASSNGSDEKEYATGGETGGEPEPNYRDPYYESSAKLAYFKGILDNRLRAKNPKAYQQYFAGLKGTYTQPNPDKARAKYIKDSTYEDYLSPEEVVSALGKNQHAEYLKSLQQVNSYNIEQGLQPLYGDVEGEADLPLLNYGKRFASLQMTPSISAVTAPGTPRERKFSRQYVYNPKTGRVDIKDEGDVTAKPSWLRPKMAMGGKAKPRVAKLAEKYAMGGNMTAGAGDAIAGGAGGLAQLLSGIITMAEGTPDYSEQPIVNASTIKNMATPYDQFATGGIHIKKKNRGKFTASAKRAGMGVQAFASKVLANKGKYSSTLVKRANFARNASKWKHAYGGDAGEPIEVEGGEMMQTPNGMMTQVSGPSHENGGVDVNVPDGTKIYSDRLKIEGETMKQRKLNRERTMARLEKMSSARPTDRLLKNTYDRTKFQTELEEAQDMKLQNAMNAIYNNEPMAEQMGGMEGGEEGMQEQENPQEDMMEGGEEEMQYRYGGRKRYAYGDEIGYEDPYGINDPFTPKIGGMATSGYIPPLMGNPLTAPRIPINEGRIGLDVTNPNLVHDTGGVDMSPEIQLPGTGYHGLYLNKKAAVPKELIPPEKGPDDGDPYGISAGDYIGMAGNAFNAIAPILNTKANARATKPNINRWKGFGQRAIDTNQSSLDALETAKSEALRDVETSVGSSRLANRSSARGVNTQRALDAASTLGANKARAAARLGFVNSVVGQLGQRSQLLNVQDARERMGQTAADQANAMDVDNYYSSMAGNLVNLGTNVQGIGQNFNRARQRRDDIRLLNKLSPNGYRI